MISNRYLAISHLIRDFVISIINYNMDAEIAHTVEFSTSQKASKFFAAADLDESRDVMLRMRSKRFQDPLLESAVQMSPPAKAQVETSVKSYLDNLLISKAIAACRIRTRKQRTGLSKVDERKLSILP